MARTQLVPGSLEVICGPMFSGKTEELIRRLREASSNDLRVVALKPDVDDRHGAAELVSHSGTRMPATAVPSTREAGRIARGFDVVGIDEAQFFDAGLPAMAGRLRAEGHRVCVAGLDLDFLRRPFAGLPELIKRADTVERRQAKCDVCGAAAPFTQRLYAGRPAGPTAPLMEMGGKELYEARCERCYLDVSA